MKTTEIIQPNKSAVPSLISIGNRDTLLIVLRHDVLYVILTKPGTIMAKLIDINNIKNTFKPNTDTAAVLLYMLARADNDPILLADYLSKIGEKFPERDGDVINFLTILDQKKLLAATIVPLGTQGAQDLDPKGLLETLSVWEAPGLILGDPADIRAKTVYTSGYGPVPIRR